MAMERRHASRSDSRSTRTEHTFAANCLQRPPIRRIGVMTTKPPHIPPETFGDRVTRARRHAHLGSTELALRLGLSKATVSKWERNEGQPRNIVEVSRNMAEICEVPYWWLLTGEETHPAQPAAGT